jgi:hypothetical protein
MTNPYHSKQASQFWKTGVADVRDDLRPMMAKTLRITDSDKIVTAGSCFAQNVGIYLRDRQDATLHTTEPLREGDPVFSARTGNIYTPRQLMQLLAEALDQKTDPACAVLRHDGRYVDIHRPYMNPEGYESVQDVLDARSTHLDAVRAMFEDADVFVFTLGLTEAWRARGSGRTLPVCPGLYSDTDDFEITNDGYADVAATMETFITTLTSINPGVRILLTVSPVPLTATYTDDPVLVATMHSKSLLRVVCSACVERHANTFYFPSYEMISNPYTHASPYNPENLRTVLPFAIEQVMSVFESTYIVDPKPRVDEAPVKQERNTLNSDRPDDEVLCDDVEIEKSMGF